MKLSDQDMRYLIEVLRQRAEPLSTADLVAALRSRHG
jgi:hypothetical protein